MTFLIKTALLGISAAIFSSVLSDIKKEYTVLIRVTSVVLISLAVLNVLKDKMYDFSVLVSDFSEFPQLTAIMLKGVIILIISDFCSDICTESGSLSVARAVQFAARVMIFILSYPLVEAIITMAISFAGG